MNLESIHKLLFVSVLNERAEKSENYSLHLLISDPRFSWKGL